MNGGAATLDEPALTARFTPAFLAGFPPAPLQQLLRESALEQGPLRVTGVVGPTTTTAPIALAETRAGEQVEFAASAAQLRAARASAPLRPMPLIVLAHGRADGPQPGTPPEIVEAQEQLWRELQADLAGLVPNGRLIVAERSGHVIQQDQPELVVEALSAVVDAVRQITLAAAAGK